MSGVDLGNLAAIVEAYRAAKKQISDWEEVAAQCRAQIEAALGDYEVGTVDGAEVVRWTRVTTNRLDQTLLKGQFPEVFRACQTPTTSRRFTLVD